MNIVETKGLCHSFDGFSPSYAEPLLQYLKEKENENT